VIFSSHVRRDVVRCENQLQRPDVKGGEELAELMGKAQSANQTIVEIQQRIREITETLSQ
jgi:hypothetical protein